MPCRYKSHLVCSGHVANDASRTTFTFSTSLLIGPSIFEITTCTYPMHKCRRSRGSHEYGVPRNGQRQARKRLGMDLWGGYRPTVAVKGYIQDCLVGYATSQPHRQQCCSGKCFTSSKRRKIPGWEIAGKNGVKLMPSDTTHEHPQQGVPTRLTYRTVH